MGDDADDGRGDEMLDDEEWAQLRAAIERRQDEFLRFLRDALAPVGGGRDAKLDAVGAELFKLVGVQTFWLYIGRPSRRMARMVREKLDEVTVGHHRVRA